MQINCEEKDIRIDKYLANNTNYSREKIVKMINENKIKVNDKFVKASYKVKENDIIDIPIEYNEEVNIEAEDIPLDIVYEDKYLMVINKPSGLVVHPGNGNKNHTLVNALVNYTNNLSDVNLRPGIVHRIDKDTSGLMLVAKTNECHEILSKYFQNHEVVREYIALVDGVIPVNSGIIDAPIKRSKDNFLKMEVNKDGKKAITHFEVIKRYKKNTLIKLVLETGRTHQIRVHLAYIGYPIFNDPIYNTNKSNEFGQFLHSKKITFIHPITKEKLTFDSELPKEFSSYLDNLE